MSISCRPPSNEIQEANINERIRGRIRMGTKAATEQKLGASEIPWQMIEQNKSQYEQKILQNTAEFRTNKGKKEQG